MRVANLNQPSFNTSMMGVVTGAIDHFDLPCDAPRAFVGSGHAFLINIHPELCPSGPYVWKYDTFMRLLENVGLQVDELGVFFVGSTSVDEKRAVEERIKQEIEDGAVVSLLHLDNQLVLGHDDTGFDVAQPWQHTVESTPARLTYGTWEEFANGPPVAFFSFRPGSGATDEVLIAEGIEYALSLWDAPENHTDEPYGVGPKAYSNWLDALAKERVDSHGAWWNAAVWGECRALAGRFFADLGDAKLGGLYSELAGALNKAGAADTTIDEQRSLVERACALEARSVDALRDFARG